MRIALIAAGAGPRFYCENCARDDALERSLRDRGHEVAADSPASDRHQPLFYGAVNLYLRHRFPSLRSAPRWVGRLLDAPPLLRAAGAMAGATNASGLAGLTLSNCLLLGIARRVRRELGAEDRAVAWQVLWERAVDVDLFLPVSRWYARFMAERMAIPEARITIVPVGIDVEAFAAYPGGLPFDPPVVGYLSRVCERMGAGLLADAIVLLLEGGRFPGLRLRYTGGSTAADASLITSIKRRIARAGGRAEFVHAFGQEDRARFIASLTVLSVPVPGSEAFGTFLLEAGAAGVPVVQPRAGGFTELVDDTGGGLLCEPGSAESLARALSDLPSDRDQAHSLGRAGSHAVRARYSTASMAAGLEAAVERASRSR